MMVKHLIILSSSYSTGRRIVMHFLDEDKDKFRAAVDAVSQIYGGKEVQFSLHSIVTESAEWESVVESDPYFDDVQVVPTVEEFTDLIRRDRYFSGITVGKYILSMYHCTHTRLEKLVYFCYADYLCATKEKLFEDEIYAFDYGPVVKTVFTEYSRDSKTVPGAWLAPHTEVAPEKDVQELPFGVHKMPFRSRIIFAEDGSRKIQSIDSTLERLKDVPTQELVNMTHREGSPWSQITPRGYHSLITDDIILKGHSAEI